MPSQPLQLYQGERPKKYIQTPSLFFVFFLHSMDSDLHQSSVCSFSTHKVSRNCRKVALPKNKLNLSPKQRLVVGTTHLPTFKNTCVDLQSRIKRHQPPQNALIFLCRLNNKVQQTVSKQISPYERCTPVSTHFVTGNNCICWDKDYCIERQTGIFCDKNLGMGMLKDPQQLGNVQKKNIFHPFRQTKQAGPIRSSATTAVFL